VNQQVQLQLVQFVLAGLRTQPALMYSKKLTAWAEV